jgi:hypothetical protein
MTRVNAILRVKHIKVKLPLLCKNKFEKNIYLIEKYFI